ncbi:unnamed protein product, partial [Mesorhabditis belari]|uniref:Uncharacterized protein n=1 Tax=Mesorhabditis belari TaxID=2138241 RepID=A0AAF3JAA8_9BILA
MERSTLYLRIETGHELQPGENCRKPKEKPNYMCVSDCTYALRMNRDERWDLFKKVENETDLFKHEALACGNFYEKFNGHKFEKGKPCSVRAFNDEDGTRELLCRCSSRKCNEKIAQWVINHYQNLSGTFAFHISFVDFLLSQQDSLIAELNEKALVTEEKFEKEMTEMRNETNENFEKLIAGTWTDKIRQSADLILEKLEKILGMSNGTEEKFHELDANLNEREVLEAKLEKTLMDMSNATEKQFKELADELNEKPNVVVAILEKQLAELRNANNEKFEKLTSGSWSDKQIILAVVIAVLGTLLIGSIGMAIAIYGLKRRQPKP